MELPTKNSPIRTTTAPRRIACRATRVAVSVERPSEPTGAGGAASTSNGALRWSVKRRGKWGALAATAAASATAAEAAASASSAAAAAASAAAVCARLASAHACSAWRNSRVSSTRTGRRSSRAEWSWWGTELLTAGVSTWSACASSERKVPTGRLPSDTSSSATGGSMATTACARPPAGLTPQRAESTSSARTSACSSGGSAVVDGPSGGTSPSCTSSRNDWQSTRAASGANSTSGACDGALSGEAATPDPHVSASASHAGSGTSAAGQNVGGESGGRVDAAVAAAPGALAASTSAMRGPSRWMVPSRLARSAGLKCSASEVSSPSSAASASAAPKSGEPRATVRAERLSTPAVVDAPSSVGRVTMGGEPRLSVVRTAAGGVPRPSATSVADTEASRSVASASKVRDDMRASRPRQSKCSSALAPMRSVALTSGTFARSRNCACRAARGVSVDADIRSVASGSRRTSICAAAMADIHTAASDAELAVA
eukprot:scaffold113980_cov24-Tisochrysis_lutea.AAC.4